MQKVSRLISCLVLLIMLSGLGGCMEVEELVEPLPSATIQQDVTKNNIFNKTANQVFIEAWNNTFVESQGNPFSIQGQCATVTTYSLIDKNGREKALSPWYVKTALIGYQDIQESFFATEYTALDIDDVKSMSAETFMNESEITDLYVYGTNFSYVTDDNWYDVSFDDDKEMNELGAIPYLSGYKRGFTQEDVLSQFVLRRFFYVPEIAIMKSEENVSDFYFLQKALLSVDNCSLILSDTDTDCVLFKDEDDNIIATINIGFNTEGILVITDIIFDNLSVILPNTAYISDILKTERKDVESVFEDINSFSEEYKDAYSCKVSVKGYLSFVYKDYSIEYIDNLEAIKDDFMGFDLYETIKQDAEDYKDFTPAFCLKEKPLIALTLQSIVNNLDTTLELEGNVDLTFYDNIDEWKNASYYDETNSLCTVNYDIKAMSNDNLMKYQLYMQDNQDLGAIKDLPTYTSMLNIINNLSKTYYVENILDKQDIQLYLNTDISKIKELKAWQINKYPEDIFINTNSHSTDKYNILKNKSMSSVPKITDVDTLDIQSLFNTCEGTFYNLDDIDIYSEIRLNDIGEDCVEILLETSKSIDSDNAIGGKFKYVIDRDNKLRSIEYYTRNTNLNVTEDNKDDLIFYKLHGKYDFSYPDEVAIEIPKALENVIVVNTSADKD